jgi:hypothetical protein
VVVVTVTRENIISDWSIRYPDTSILIRGHTYEGITSLVRKEDLSNRTGSDNIIVRQLPTPKELQKQQEKSTNQDFPTCKEMDPELKEQLEAQQDPNYDGIKKRYYNPNCPKYNTG